jgi:hypothetical protein
VEYARYTYDFLWLQQDIEGDGSGVGLRIVAAPAVVHQVNLRVERPLGATAGAAGDAESHLVGLGIFRSLTAHVYHGDAPVIPALIVAHVKHAARRNECDENNDADVDASENGELARDADGSGTAPAKKGNDSKNEHDDGSEKDSNEEQVEQRHCRSLPHVAGCFVL